MTSRISYRDLPNGLAIRIAAPKNIWGIVFLPFWWAGWTVAVAFAWATLVLKGDLFLALWLLIAMPIWFAIPAIWSWWLFGHEEVAATGDALMVGRRLSRLRQEKTFAVKDIRNLRAAGFFGDPWNRRNYWSVTGYWWGFGGGMIAFDHGGGVQRFGINLEEGDASEIVDRLRPFVS